MNVRIIIINVFQIYNMGIIKMKDMTITVFCKKYDACQPGIDWAAEKLPGGMMSELWPVLIEQPEYLIWVATQEYVFSDRDNRIMACRFVRETPIGDGRTVWDLLTDERSRNAVIVAERYCNGEATEDELAAAGAAAWAAVWAAVWAAARAAAWTAEQAAGAAAWTAEQAAGAATWAAARAAAWTAEQAAATWAAARAARAEQAKIIMEFGNPFLEVE